jgi:serine protease Do
MQRPSSLHRAASVSALLAAFAACAFGQAPPPQRPPDDLLQRLNQSVDGLIRKVSPSVVQILVTGFGPLEESERGSASVILGRQRAIGSGFVIDPSGYIVTNAHVVNGAQRVEVVLPPATEGSGLGAASTAGEAVPARIVGVTREIDLAVLKIEGKNLMALPLGDYRNVRQGELVFAMGSPGGLQNTVTMGVVSSVARQTDPDSPMVYIQTDAPINPGNSGGPLVNASGQVVGVNTFILSESGGNEGLGFAIPGAVVKIAYEQIRRFGHLHHANIGIGVQAITRTLSAGLNLPRDHGVIISDVQPDSSAQAAGLQIGDVIVAMDGRAVENVPIVGFHLLTREYGEKVHVDVLRGKQTLSFDVAVMQPPRDMDQVTSLADPEKGLVPALGIVGVEIDDKIASMVPDLRDPFGIIVAARTTGAGAEIPLASGDVIRTLNGEPMTTIDKLRTKLKSLPAGSAAVLQIQRDEKLLFISFTLETQ